MTSPFYLAALATIAIPSLQVVGIRTPVSQTSDFVWTEILDATGKNWVVKVPLTTEAGVQIEAELELAGQLLSELQYGNLPFDVMRPGGSTSSKHGRALIYAAPFGKSLDFATLTTELAHELGRTLAAIHNLRPNILLNSGLPAYSIDELRQRLRTELLDACESGKVPIILRRRWEQAIDNNDLWNFTPCLVHGDIADEQILWSERRVSCVLGFGQAHIGDPALDFASVTSIFTEEQFTAALESYTNARDFALDDSFVTRTVLLGEFAVLRWLNYGLRTQNKQIIAEAQELLAELEAEIVANPDLAPAPNWQVDTEYAQLGAWEDALDEEATAPTAYSPDSALDLAGADELNVVADKEKSS